MEDGVEVSGRDLYDGWYTRSTKPKQKQKQKPKAKANPNPKPKPVMPVTKGQEPTPNNIEISNSLEIGKLSLQVADLTVSSNGCNDMNALELSRFKSLRSIEIGNDCFELVQTLKIEGLNRLKTIKIGRSSFTQEKNNCGNDKSKSFHILNCESLESIQIGEFSFSDFAGDFELKNLPQLQSIQIGEVGNESVNFYRSPFVIRGIELILII